MLTKSFLEDFALYRRFKTPDIPVRLTLLTKIAVKMKCHICATYQTFAVSKDYHQITISQDNVMDSLVFSVSYLCMHCTRFERFFLIKVDEDRESYTKIGQFPAWDTQELQSLSDMIGKHASLYKKGLICESQSYGIGAYGYYRRIVEVAIDDLLDEIPQILSESELESFQEALERTKKTTVTHEKIGIVKNLLPPILRPDGINPLSILHSALSEGLHADSDEECMEQAILIREALVFLIDQLQRTRSAAKGFTQSIKMLEKKKRSKAGK